MSVKVKIAETQNEREQAYRLRYEVYATELALPMKHAEHRRRQIVDPLDEDATLLIAVENDVRVVGTMRLNLARQPGGLGEYVDLYELERFRQYYPSSVAITTRNCVHPDYRNRPVSAHMARRAFQHYISQGICFDVIDCQPHLQNFHERLGYRVINDEMAHPDDPELCHLVMGLPLCDVEYLTSVRSPFRKLVPRGTEDPTLSSFLSSLLAQSQSA